MIRVHGSFRCFVSRWSIPLSALPPAANPLGWILFRLGPPALCGCASNVASKLGVRGSTGLTKYHPNQYAAFRHTDTTTPLSFRPNSNPTLPPPLSCSPPLFSPHVCFLVSSPVSSLLPSLPAVLSSVSVPRCPRRIVCKSLRLCASLPELSLEGATLIIIQ